MIVAESIATARGLLEQVRRAHHSVGFVPTMGALHDGHLSLMRRSVAENDFTVASNFVNPLQFAPDEDFERYPRDLTCDNQLCEQVGVDLVLAPSVEEMFAQPATITMQLAELGELLEGRFRPGHLEGVAVAVTKLLSIVGGCRVYFGEKDWQQLCVARRLVQDFSLPVEVVGCDIVREADGLAMSSRNLYLTPEQRQGATVLFRALRHGAELLTGSDPAAGSSAPADGQSAPAAGSSAPTDGQSAPASVSDPPLTAEAVGGAMAELITAEPVVDALQYAVVVDPATLSPPAQLAGELRLLVAAQVGSARLIDNLGVRL